jgi:peptidoglycan/LPS O-acetylase OafA/YrhL
VKQRYLFLDGMRGLAALFVLLHHISMADRDFGGAPRPAWLRVLVRPLDYGHYAVAVFIVLSGFCLMLPVMASEDRRLRGGVGRYLVRRAKRICPPYYAALILTLVLLAAVPSLRLPNGSSWDVALPPFGFRTVASHFLLLHDLSPQWILKIDPPMWSVAIEWHIYFLFAFALLPAWRRWGSWPLLLTTAAAGVGSHFATQGRLDFLSTGYIAQFVVGMTAAHVASRGTRAFWHGAAATATLLTVAYFVAGGGFAYSRTYLSDSS